jgi:7-carboxy-7-deazaguanine synthase
MFGRNEVVSPSYFKDFAPDSLMVTSVFATLQGENPFSGEPAVFVRMSKCNRKCHFCFVPSTPILMGDGSYKRIDQIQVGDVVMSYGDSGFEPKPVIKLYQSQAQEIFKVTAQSTKVWCTADHPFLTSNRGWVAAKDLTAEDILVHWGSSTRMTMFNPSYVGQKPNISPETRQAAAERMSNLWKRPEFRADRIHHLKTNNPMKDPEVVYRSHMSREDRGKTGLETRFEKICDGLPITYVGDGNGLHIAHRVPDFVVEGQNKVIEIWSSDAPWAAYRDQSWMNSRKELFENQGYQVLFVPLDQKDLRMDNHPKIRQNVIDFIHNGKKVTSVEKVTAQNSFVQLYGSKDAIPTVFNLEVADNHTYVANSLVVHNCDTWFDSGDTLTFEEILTKIHDAVDREVERNQIRREAFMDRLLIVITGGEPMLQKNLTSFLEFLHDQGFRTQIESNGDFLRPLPESTTLVVSPKANLNTHRYGELRPDVFARANVLKFVVSADPENIHHDVPEYVHEFRKQKGPRSVFVSPMNVYNQEPTKVGNNATMEMRSEVDERISFWTEGLLNQTENRKNHEYAALMAMRHGLALNLQVHLYASLP